MISLVLAAVILGQVKGGSWTNPDKEAPLTTAEAREFLREWGGGHFFRISNGYYVNVAADYAPATPLSDLTHTATTPTDNLYGFPDGRVDASDFELFIQLWLNQSPLANVSAALGKDTNTAVDNEDLAIFIESYAERFGILADTESSFRLQAPTSSALSWQFRQDLWNELHHCGDFVNSISAIKMGYLRPIVPPDQNNPDDPQLRCGRRSSPSDCDPVRMDVKMTAFIDSRAGDLGFPPYADKWRYSPRVWYAPFIVPEFYFAVDQRKACQTGTSRLAVTGWIMSDEVGWYSDSSTEAMIPRWLASCDASGWSGVPFGSPQFRTSKPRKRVAIYHSAGCETKVRVTAEANYPFLPMSAIQTLADVTVSVDFTFEARGRQRHSCNTGYVAFHAKGVHSAFPSWDISTCSDGYSNCPYTYYSPDDVPSPFNMNTDVIFNDVQSVSSQGHVTIKC